MAIQTPEYVGLSASSLARALRRSWALVVGATLVGPLIGLLVYQISPDAYRATATLTIAPITSDVFASGPLTQQVNVGTEATIMKSANVCQTAASKLSDGTTGQELCNDLKVAIPYDSIALSVTSSGSTAEQAADRANAVAEGYLDYRRGLAEQRLDDYRKRVEERIAVLEGQPGAELEVNDLRLQLSRSYLTVVNPGEVVTRAVPPSRPSSPKLILNLAGGLAVGLLTGVGLALWRGAVAGSVVSTDDVEQLLPGRTVAFRADIEALATDDRDRPFMLSDPSQQELLGLAVQIHRAMVPGTVCVIGEERLNLLAADIIENFSRVTASDGDQTSEAIDVTSEGPGDRALASAKASAIIIVALAGSSRLATSQAVSRAVSVSAKDIPLAVVLVHVQTAGHLRDTVVRAPTAEQKNAQATSR